MNVAIISGRLGHDPDLKYAQSGTAILRLRIATNERVKRDGEWQDATEWHTVVTFGKRAEGLTKILAKGTGVAVRGRMQHRSYEGRDGEKRTAHEIIADDVDVLADGAHRQRAEEREQQLDEHAPPADFGEDDIPF